MSPALTCEISVGSLKLGGANGLFLIAGPCVIESEAHARSLAERLAAVCAEVKLPYIFKTSYDKANRTSGQSYRGPGLQEGLRILRRIKDDLKLPILTDVHDVSQVGPAAEVADILQIPAFLSRQTDLLTAAGKSGRVVNIKKGQFVSPWEMQHAIEKVASTGNEKILVTERGTSFGYNNLVVDMRAFPILRGFGYPVVFDVTHSLQLPGGEGNQSGGCREFAEPLARAAVAAGVDGLFLEVHDNPDRALSDPATQLSLAQLKPLLEKLLRIRTVIAATNSPATPGHRGNPASEPCGDVGMSPDIERLANEFREEMYNTYVQARRKCHYNATRFFRMLEEHGGVETARRLLATGSVIQTGLAELWKCKRLDLSVEAKVLMPKYEPLFSDEVRGVAKERLRQYGFDLDGWLKNPP